MEVKSSLIVSRPHARESIRFASRKSRSVDSNVSVENNVSFDTQESSPRFSVDAIGKDYDNLQRDDRSGLSYLSKKALSKFEQVDSDEEQDELKSLFEFKVVV